MDNQKQKKINRNNRKRGGTFEKKVADYLEFEVVPYSGSNARFGFGDVRNDEWLIECKNITPKPNQSVVIKSEWLRKNRERASDVNKMSCIAWMPYGKSDKFILLEYEEYSSLGLKHEYEVPILPKVHNTKNLIIDISAYYIKDVRKGMIIELVFNNESYYIMSLEKFKEVINDSKNRS